MIHGENRERVGVVLFQLGGPDSPEAIEPFLYNLFSDPDIIDFPFARLARPALARLIASRRANKLQKHYASIGGKSPLRNLTEQQASALEKELRRTVNARVFVAMRYWHPLTEDAVREVEAHAFDQLILLPLYPQYSRTTTRSSLNEWSRKYSAPGRSPVPTKVIGDFHKHPVYLESVVERINQGLGMFRGSKLSDRAAKAGAAEYEPGDGDSPGAEARPGPSCEHCLPTRLKQRPDIRFPEDVHLVFSAHGVPKSVIEAGDPYQAQVEETTALVIERGGWPNPHRLCYQSRVGPGRWLEPALRQTLRELAAGGAEKVLVVPISFVSDHVETLHEIDIEARQFAEGLGIRQFRTMPALNDSAKFIEALAELVLQEAGIKVPAPS